jgi:vacuolar-type H+-ATPase subunit E/Vma4
VPIDTLLDALARDAAAEAERTLGAARAEAAHVTEAAHARIAARREAALAARRAELRARADAGRTEALRASRLLELTARDRLVSRVLERAAALLPCALAEDAVRRAALARAEAAIACWPRDEAVTVRCAPPLEAPLRVAVAARPRAALTPDPAVAAGAVVEAADGSARVDGTLEALLGSERARLAIEIARLAEPPEDPS